MCLKLLSSAKKCLEISSYFCGLLRIYELYLEIQLLVNIHTFQVYMGDTASAEARQEPLNIWTEHSNCRIHSRGDSKILTAWLITNIFLNVVVQNSALLFLSSSQTSQNLKFIPKCPFLSSLTNKFQGTQKNF